MTNKKKGKPTSFKPGNTDMFILLARQQLGLEFVKEHCFHPARKWRFDYACLAHKIALEVEGGIWKNGRHTRGKGYKGDMEKYNAATLLGWRLIRVTPSELISEGTLRMIKDMA